MTSTMLRGFSLLMLVLSLTAGEAPEVPALIKPAADTYEADAMKAYVAYQQAIAKAADKAAKDMDAKLKVAVKSGNLELANSIKAYIDAMNDGTVLAELESKLKQQAAPEKSNKGASDLLGDALVGKWGDGTTVMWDFKADGTGQHFWGGAIYPFTWAKNDAGYSVVVAGHRPRPLSFVDKNTIQVEPGRSIRMK